MSFFSKVTLLFATLSTIYLWQVLGLTAENTTFTNRSFAPVRESNEVKWLVDGEDYMSAVADAIEEAKYEILITDWQIHPFLHLKRPPTGVKDLKWRLSELLSEKADKGVKIYILLYWEIKELLDLGSNFATSTLGNNIVIVRHPNITLTGSIPPWFGFSSWTNVISESFQSKLVSVWSELLSLRFSHHEKVVVVDRSVAFVGGIDLCFGRWDTHDHPLTDNYSCHPEVLVGKNNESRVNKHVGTLDKNVYCRWVGMDYHNTFRQGARVRYNKSFRETLVNGSPARNTTPRMPWHDVGCMFSGDSVADVVKHFVERYNAISSKKLSENWNHSRNLYQVPDPTFSARIQVVRSVANLSVSQSYEDSIHQVYLNAIKNSQHFIYIENQFFVSMDDDRVVNNIKTALYERILQAFNKNQTFHVIVILPLKTEDEENWCTWLGGALESITCYNYETLFRGDQSLYVKLENEGVPVDDYLSVYGLRTHDILDGKPVTEIIYVHSKLMIVDDRITIIGSANINDRSMLGRRDSEVDVVIEDKEMIHGKMDGENYDVGKFSHSLRCQLMKEHLGVLKGHNFIEVSDPIAQHFLSRISNISRENTNIYERVFNGSLSIFPTDQVKKDKADFKKWKTWRGLASTSFSEAVTELENINGHLVSFPRSFMENECKRWKLFNIIGDPYFKFSYGPVPLKESQDKYSIEGRYLVADHSGQFYC